jgi:hypothetical protein
MADQHAWLQPLVDAVVTHAQAIGRFERVNGHEPVSAPGNGLTCAVWPQEIVSTRSSGLRSTSILVMLSVRIFAPGMSEPRDDVDPTMVAALSNLLAEYHRDFTLGGLVRQVDIFGQHGRGPLRAVAGWLTPKIRVYTINLPLVVDGVWTQGG